MDSQGTKQRPSQHDMVRDLKDISDRVGKPYKEVHGYYKRLVRKVNKLLGLYKMGVGASDYGEVYAAIGFWSELQGKHGNPSLLHNQPEARKRFAKTLSYKMSEFRANRNRLARAEAQTPSTIAPTVQEESLTPPSSEQGKVTLKLLPLDEESRAAVEASGNTPNLELTVKRSKPVSSIMRHLRAKWCAARELLISRGRDPATDLLLYWRNPLRPDSTGHKVAETSSPAGTAFGNFSELFLSYRWSHARIEHPRPKRHIVPVPVSQDAPGSSHSREPLRSVTPSNCNSNNNAAADHNPEPPHASTCHDPGVEGSGSSPVSRASTWVNREDEALRLMRDENVPPMQELLPAWIDDDPSSLPGGGAQVLDPERGPWPTQGGQQCNVPCNNELDALDEFLNAVAPFGM